MSDLTKVLLEDRSNISIHRLESFPREIKSVIAEKGGPMSYKPYGIRMGHLFYYIEKSRTMVYLSLRVEISGDRSGCYKQIENISVDYFAA